MKVHTKRCIPHSSHSVGVITFVLHTKGREFDSRCEQSTEYYLFYFFFSLSL